MKNGIPISIQQVCTINESISRTQEDMHSYLKETKMIQIISLLSSISRNCVVFFNGRIKNNNI